MTPKCAPTARVLGKSFCTTVGRGAGGDVEVLWLEAEQEIADAAAGEVGLMACGSQGQHDVACGDVARVGDG